MNDQVTIYDRKEKKTLVVKDIVTGYQWSYISAYFEKRPNLKPIILINIDDWDLPTVRNRLNWEFENDQVHVSTIATYLYRLAPLVKDNLLDDWMSYGVQIGNKADEINPLSLVNFQPTVIGSIIPPQFITSSEEDDKWLSTMACCQYRLSFASELGSYDTNLIKRFQDVLKDAGYKGDTNLTRSTSFQTSSILCALISAYDMFMSKFPHHPFALLQMGSIISKYQDCTILGTLQSVKAVLSIELQELYLWAFADPLIKECQIVLGSPDELTKLDSYTPYLRGFKLANKSPYASGTLINLHTWLNFIGICLGMVRSRNSRYIEGGNFADVPANAFLVGYVYRRSSDMRRVFVLTEDEDAKLTRKENLIKPAIPLINREPDKRHPGAWFSWWATKHFRIVPEMKTFLEQVQKGLGHEVRPGSLGESFKNYVF